jgi:tetratricopeptide (TPR) repeat protein
VNTSNNYVELANLMVERGQMEKGVEYYNKALDILEEIGDLYYQSRIFNNLSDLYLQNGDYEKSLEYVELCIDNSLKTQNRRLLGFGYVNGAEALGRLNRIDEALEYAEKGEEIFEELEDPYSLGFMNHVYGIIYRMDGKIEEAKEKIVKAIDNYTEADIPYYIAKARLDLALLEKMDGNVKTAMEEASKALEIWTNIKAEKMMQEAEGFLASLQE